jgi:hypothetical protein
MALARAPSARPSRPTTWRPLGRPPAPLRSSGSASGSVAHPAPRRLRPHKSRVRRAFTFALGEAKTHPQPGPRRPPPRGPGCPATSLSFLLAELSVSTTYTKDTSREFFFGSPPRSPAPVPCGPSTPSRLLPRPRLLFFFSVPSDIFLFFVFLFVSFSFCLSFYKSFTIWTPQGQLLVLS